MAWVLFRLENWNDALTFYKQLFDYKDIKFVELNNSFIFILLIAIVFSLFGRTKIGSNVAALLMAQNPVVSLSNAVLITFSTILLLFFSIVFLSASDLNPFIYYRF